MMPRRAWAYLGLLFAVSLLILGSARTAVEAEEPGAISQRVNDSAGAIGDRQSVEAALDRLERERDYQLFLLYVQTTQPRTIASFLDETVQRSNLSTRDGLPVVA